MPFKEIQEHHFINLDVEATKDPQSTYYDAGGISTLDIIEAKLSDEQYKGFLLGNILKYACRMNHKGCSEDDARKVVTYAKWLYEMEADND